MRERGTTYILASLRYASLAPAARCAPLRYDYQMTSGFRLPHDLKKYSAPLIIP